jgi:hypothetical protein
VANGVYEEPGRLGHRQRRRWDGGFTPTTTALAHEAYLKLAGQRRRPTESRVHFSCDRFQGNAPHPVQLRA